MPFIFHGALVGRMRTNIETQPAGELFHCRDGRLLPGDTAMEVGVEYASVVVFGLAEVITDSSRPSMAFSCY